MPASPAAKQGRAARRKQHREINKNKSVICPASAPARGRARGAPGRANPAAHQGPPAAASAPHGRLAAGPARCPQGARAPRRSPSAHANSLLSVGGQEGGSPRARASARNASERPASYSRLTSAAEAPGSWSTSKPRWVPRKRDHALLAADLWASRRLGVCAAEGSPCAAARPLLRLVEVSGHGLPWLLGTAYGLWRSGSAAAREVLLNLLFALLLDLVLVAVVKGLVRRPRPAHNKMDMFATISVDKYSFPSGHATRAALVCRFVLHHLVLAAPLRVLVVLWALVVSLSRVMLGRHNVTDVLFGLLLGYALYSVVQYCWLSPLSAPALFALWSH
uniref:Polyisoprenoid diphosphate/phosphate phosphohydrolase PLPP6 n=1 Tax=Nothoprocta perdicaria TaxID=30464 RepID=A0A8C6YT34_NOTPE